MPQALQLNEQGFIVGGIPAISQEEIDANPLLVNGPAPDGLYWPCWVFTSEKWVEGDPEAATKRLKASAENARRERDAKLRSTDWLILRHLEEGTEIPANWKSYRKALRDLPAQVGFPHNVNWPKAPKE